jgi:hypothetical protein
MAYRPARPFLAVEVSNLWRFPDFPPETTVADLLNSDTWVHCAERYLKPYDEVIVIPQGGTFRAHLIVMDAGKGFAKMRLLDAVALNGELGGEVAVADAPEALSDDAPVKVEWKGPQLKYTVIRKKDGEKLRSGFAVKAEATGWAVNHIHAMA